MKPTPPKDLWEKMDAALAEIRPEPGPNWFTMVQFQERYGLKRFCARSRLNDLDKAGKLIHHGNIRGMVYYELK